MNELIGQNAGKIWNALNDLGKMNVKQLKKITKIRTDKELFSAIGWLAKEGKLAFDESGEEMMMFLIY
ncbi:winged helix-turn-helix domain-containing protein [Porphyromonas macacae]|nr:winged helix-turn-helix domain-containing protein [Porphyromonas macacae]